RRRFEEWYARRKEFPERTVELRSYHAMLGCVLTGMGAAMVPRSVISTFPESKRLRVTALAKGQSLLRILMVWPKGVRSPKVEALSEVLSKDRELIDAPQPITAGSRL
ncbi:MAG: LysR substrate-binding domain-containing protein, partial [Holophagales bacterium]|nr:LysR substrate-binding domain-containing protein [Holophagales bacterium]